MTSFNNSLIASKEQIADILNRKLQSMRPRLHLNQVDESRKNTKEKNIFLPGDMWAETNGEKTFINNGKDANGNPIHIQPEQRKARTNYLYDINSRAWKILPSKDGLTLRIELETDGNEIKGWRKRGKAKRRDKWAADANINPPDGHEFPFIEIDINQIKYIDGKASLAHLTTNDVRVGMEFDGNGFIEFFSTLGKLFTFGRFDFEDKIGEQIENKIIQAILSSANKLFSELPEITDELINDQSSILSSKPVLSQLRFSRNRAIVSFADIGDPSTQRDFSYFTQELNRTAEDLYLKGERNIDGAGNNRSNKIIGNDAHNTLKGKAGNDILSGKGGDDRLFGGIGKDSLVGGIGNDEIYGDSGNDVARGGAGNDKVRGGAGNDQLTGGFGNDLIDGGTGLDTMSGGPGNDHYIVDETNDIVSERDEAGTDKVTASIDYKLGANIERLTLSNSAMRGTGNELNNYILGNRFKNVIKGEAGNDYLDGKGGDDILQGGDGDDILIGAIGKDRLLGEDGDDTLDAGLLSYTQTRQPHYLLAEPRYLNGGLGNDTLFGGLGDDQLVGAAGADVMNGWSGDDYLKGGLGKDIMNGGLGNDEYTVNDKADQVIEAKNEGIDTIYASTDYTLPAHVENMTLRELVVYGGGNNLNNTIRGNEGGNTIKGADGNDTLYGFGSNDQLTGENGDDYLYGGSGRDTLTGGTGDDKLVGDDGDDLLAGGLGRDRLVGGQGADTFIFDSFEQRTDFIADFSHAQNDKIQISAKALGGDLQSGLLDNSQFTLGSSATTANTRFIFNQPKGVLYYDSDGTGAAKAVEILAFSSSAELTASDISITA